MIQWELGLGLHKDFTLNRKTVSNVALPFEMLFLLGWCYEHVIKFFSSNRINKICIMGKVQV